MRPEGAAAPVVGVRLSLWRAAAAFRVTTLIAATYLIGRWHDLYARFWIAALVGAAMVVVTGAVGWLAVTGRAHRISVVVADVVLTAVLTFGTIPAQTASQRHGSMPTLTTLWAAGPAIEAGIVFGVLSGVVAGGIQFGVAVAVRDGYDGRTLTSGLLVVLAGGVVGYVARLTVRAEDEVRAATAERAAADERERLSRSVHDGVLQVLGLVARDGEGDLAAEAARQEAALRGLITTSAPLAAGSTDLAAALRALASERVAVAVTTPTVVLRAHAAAEIAAAVRAALDNVAAHAGADARAWILLERVDDEVRVTVRDDGLGIPDGRLDQATASGRLGVVSSIRGRIVDLGGTVEITSRPGHGTTVEIRVRVGGPA